MSSFSLNMKFWDDGMPDSTRVRNVNFSWKKLKELSSFLRENGIDCKEFLYDFSPTKMLDESKHVSYPLGVYKKAEKTNIILNDNSNYDFFMMIDCDAFFDYDDFKLLLDLIKTAEEGDVFTFDLAKLHDGVDQYLIDGNFIKENADWSYAYSGNKENGPLRSYMGGLGGVYICDTNLLTSLGGFNISYVGWGGEDGEMLNRIMTSGKKVRLRPTRNFAPFHLPHFVDYNNINYTKRFQENE